MNIPAKKFSIVSLGCARNLVDSEVMAGLLQKSGYQVVEQPADAEIVMAGRYRFVLAHDEPPLIGYDQDLWVDRLHHQQAGPSELLDLFAALREIL